MTLLTINDTSYHIHMQGQGPSLLMLHGFSGNLENWTDLAQSLADTHRVITVDLLGHGQSAIPEHPDRYRMEVTASDFAEIIEEIGGGSVTLLGYSMGGRLALYLAVHYPHLIKSLILESSSPGIQSQAERESRFVSDWRLAQTILERGISWFVAHWEQIPLFATQKRLPIEKFNEQHQQRLQNNPLGLANNLLGMGTGSQPSLWGQLPQLTLPTCLIVGEKDQKFIRTNRSMLYKMPNAELHVIEDAGHNAYLEKPVEFEACLRDFLDHQRDHYDESHHRSKGIMSLHSPSL